QPAAAQRDGIQQSAAPSAAAGQTMVATPAALPVLPSVPAAGPVVTAPQIEAPRSAGRSNAAASAGLPSISGEATYRIPEGTLIETVLTNRLDGTFAGPVNCLVTTPVYTPD